MKEPYGHTMEQENKFRFGNYDLVRRIDVGGMGEVYLAKQRTAFDREVAIKIIRQDLANDSTAQQRFLREAEVSAHLKHNHVLPMYELGRENGRLFLVTPYIEGGNLARRLQHGPLPLAEVHQLFSALLTAIAYIHRQGVVHRDLKPSNILLDEGNDGQVYVRLIDFGIARLQGASASPPLTTAGNEMGTFAYMAPERLSGYAAPSNDIYSLGVILYQMLTGYLPVDEQGRPQRVPLPQPLEEVVDRCMAPRIEERFSTAEEVLQAFERAYQQVSLATRKLPMGSSPDDVMSLQSLAHTSPNGGKATFTLADYNAPTTAVDASLIGSRIPTTAIPIGKPPRRGSGRRKSIWFPIILFLTAAVLLTMSGVFAYELLALPTAIIHVTPQARLVSQVFQITASTSVTGVEVGSQAIPARVLTSNTESSSQSGPTSGQSCQFVVGGCQPAVSDFDVYQLAVQIRPTLDAQISHALQQQLQALGGTELGTVRYSYITPTSKPAIGTTATSVTVTLTGQGRVSYFLNKDAQTLAQQLLLKQMQTLGANWVPVNSTMRVGQPVVTSTDFGGTTISVAAAGYAMYQIPSQQLVAIQNHIKGQTVHNARIFLSVQSGIDPNTISIRLKSAGNIKIAGDKDVLPGDVQRITLITDPVALPPVQLPAVPTTSVQPTPPPDNGNQDNGNQGDGNQGGNGGFPIP